MRTKAHGMVAQMAVRVKQADKMLLCIAPEGTRSNVSPWKSGFVQIAHRAEIPVFLIGLDYQSKTVLCGPSFIPSEDIQAEMQKVYQFYAKVNAKYPSQVTIPVEKTFEK